MRILSISLKVWRVMKCSRQLQVNSMVQFLGSGISNHICWAHQFLQHPCNELWIQMCRYSFFFGVCFFLKSKMLTTELLRCSMLYKHISKLYLSSIFLSPLNCNWWNCYLLPDNYQLSIVICHLSLVTCHLSLVTCPCHCHLFPSPSSFL